MESDEERGTVEEMETNTEEVEKYEDEEIVLYFGKHEVKLNQLNWLIFLFTEL